MGLGVWKCSTSTFYFCDSLWQIHFTPDNLNPCYLEPLSTPGFTSYNHLLLLPSIARTIDNPNFPLTRSNFCFPSDRLYIIPPSNTWTMFYVCYKLKKKTTKTTTTVYWGQKHWIYFKTTISIHCLYFLNCHSSSNPVSITVNWSNFCCLMPFSKYCFTSFAALEVKCAWYLHSLPIHLHISLFLVSCFEPPITWTPSNWNLFWFP